MFRATSDDKDTNTKMDVTCEVKLRLRVTYEDIGTFLKEFEGHSQMVVFQHTLIVVHEGQLCAQVSPTGHYGERNPTHMVRRELDGSSWLYCRSGGKINVCITKKAFNNVKLDL